MRPKILSNKIKCNFCQDVIESKHVHDYIACSCGRVAVDGGKEYLKRTFQESPEIDYIELSEMGIQCGTCENLGMVSTNNPNDPLGWKDFCNLLKKKVDPNAVHKDCPLKKEV